MMAEAAFVLTNSCLLPPYLLPPESAANDPRGTFNVIETLLI